MDHFAGLDVSVKETNVCIVDDTGKIVREVKVASEPEALLAVSKNPAYRSMSLVPRCDRGEWGLGFPEIRKKRRLVDCSDVHDQRDESRQRKRDREESERDYGYHDHSPPLFEPGISRRPWEQCADRKALADVMAITQ